MSDAQTTTPVGTALPTTDATASFANKTVGQLLNALVPVAEAAIIAAVPWLGVPGLKQIWEMLFNYIVGQLSGALGTQASFIVMDVQEYFTLKSVSSALTQLKAAQATGDVNAIAQANAAADAAAAGLLHYGGDAHP